MVDWAERKGQSPLCVSKGRQQVAGVECVRGGVEWGYTQEIIFTIHLHCQPGLLVRHASLQTRCPPLSAAMHRM